MILNSHAVLVVFLALLRLLLGALVLALGVLAWRRNAAAHALEARVRLEERSYLVFLLSFLLLGLNVASWPLLYLLLQSYVEAWPGVMCIYGVTRIGRGSLGPSRLLPELLSLLQLTKPLLAFAGGAWFVLYVLNRRTRTAPLLSRLFLALVPLGVLASLDATAELAYVVIPKQEEFAASGCCMALFGDDSMERFVPRSLTSASGRTWLNLIFHGIHLGLVLALLAAGRRNGILPNGYLLALVLGASAALIVSGLFLVEVAAPTLLGLPHHHCPYDLIPQVPEAIVAIALYLAGLFLLGWGSVVQWCGRSPETQSALGATVRRLVQLSFWAYLTSWIMLSLALLLAWHGHT